MKKYLFLLVLVILASLSLSAGFFSGWGVILNFIGFAFIWQGEKFIRENFSKPTKVLYIFLFITLLSWNAIATWWVYLTKALWVIAVSNTLVMLVPFRIWFWLKKQLHENWHPILFAIIWIAFEFFHHHWQLTWIWLTLGNAFLYQNTWVQWYEFTGVLGGSLWILGGNIFAFRLFNKQLYINYITTTFVVLYFSIPILFSLYLYQKPLPKPQNEIEVLVVQPNIDPFTEKFSSGIRYIPLEKQTKILLELSQQNITNQTDLVVFPETAIDESFTESLITKFPDFQRVDTFVKKYQKDLLFGISTRAYYKTKQSPTSVYEKSVNAFYEDFNVAVMMQKKKDTFDIYKKMVLVPGVETIPFPEYTFFLKEFISSIGAQFFLLGTGKEQKIFETQKAKIAPVICYESMYGEFTAGFVKKGANVLCTITNDGWLGDTPWQEHHLYLGALRSIETRKSMIHCSNMGVSGFINPKGEIGKTIPYNRRTTLLGNTYTYEGKTFYVLYGDYLGRLACLIVAGLVVYALGRIFIMKKDV
ncbi:MAG: apolipoprotein N-acyltransferase [Raineya sp.]|nr:apolipoprotein N-acyltransferase [Raineya sp.]